MALSGVEASGHPPSCLHFLGTDKICEMPSPVPPVFEIKATLFRVLGHPARLRTLGAALLSVAGFWIFAAGATVGASFTGAFEPHFGVDGLTAFFLATLGLVAAPALLYASAYFRGRAMSVLCGAFVLVLA